MGKKVGESRWMIGIGWVSLVCLLLAGCATEPSAKQTGGPLDITGEPCSAWPPLLLTFLPVSLVARIDATVANPRTEEDEELVIVAPPREEVRVTFSAKRSTSPTGCPLQYLWESDGEVVGTDQEVIRTFRAGRHLITLIIQDRIGAKASAQMRVVVREAK